jgi:hypothetical protein
METEIGKEMIGVGIFFDSLNKYRLSAIVLSTDRSIKMVVRVSDHARMWYVHVAQAFPLAHHYRAALA